MEKTKVSKDLEAKTLTIERTFDAPKQKVWQAYADKDLFAQWWGPEGWQTTVKDFNFAPGGRNLYCMECVDKNQGDFYGQQSWGLMEFQTIDEPDSFTYQDFFADAEGNKQQGMPSLTITVSLVDRDGKTALVSRAQADSAEAIEKLVAMGMVEGVSSTYDRLEQLLARS